jgi:hypothetical protein
MKMEIEEPRYKNMLKLKEHDLDYIHEGYILAVAKSPDTGNTIETLSRVDPEKTRGNRGVIYCTSEYNKPLVISTVILEYADFYYITKEEYPEYFI